MHFAWKGRPRNDLYCVGRDVKPYSLTHSRAVLLGLRAPLVLIHRQESATLKILLSGRTGTRSFVTLRTLKLAVRSLLYV